MNSAISPLILRAGLFTATLAAAACMFLPQASAIKASAVSAPVKTAQAGRSDSRKTSSYDYRIWGLKRLRDVEGRSFWLAHISVDPRHFNREEMTGLAKELSRRFKRKAKIRALLFDDPLRAKGFATEQVDARDVDRYVRGVYFRDRYDGEEYLKFSSAKNRRWDEITLQLSR